jgi:hypothetical protein
MSTIERIFAEMLAPWEIRLPDAARKRGVGEIQKRGWMIRYAFGREAGVDYLDYYAVHRMTNDRHVRILESGEVRGLPAMSDMFGCGDGSEQEIAEAKRAFDAHNRRVQEELDRKFGSVKVGG